MVIILVAAVSNNHVIGKNNDLLWHMPADLEFFQETIKDKWVMVGRRSFESIQGRQLYHQRKRVIVVTRNSSYNKYPAITANGVKEALKIGGRKEINELYVLGGAEIYKQSIDIADELIITEIHSQFDGDAFFPRINLKFWKEFERTDFPSDTVNPYPYSFVRYHRRVSMDKKV